MPWLVSNSPTQIVGYFPSLTFSRHREVTPIRRPLRFKTSLLFLHVSLRQIEELHETLTSLKRKREGAESDS